jgi:hypothetical protein
MTLPNATNGKKVTFSSFFRLDSSFISEINLFSVFTTQVDSEIPNENISNLMNVILRRNIVRESSTDGFRINFPKNFKERGYSTLSTRFQLDEWYYLIFSFDFQKKQYYFAIIDFERNGQNIIFDSQQALNIDFQISQKFTIGKQIVYFFVIN